MGRGQFDAGVNGLKYDLKEDKGIKFFNKINMYLQLFSSSMGNSCGTKKIMEIKIFIAR